MTPGPDWGPSCFCRCPALTRMERERDLTVVLCFHAVLHPLVILRLPSLGIGLFCPLVLKVHVLHLLGQVICRGRRSGRGSRPARLGGTAGGCAMPPQPRDPEQRNRRGTGRNAGRGGMHRPGLALGWGRSAPGAPAGGRSPRRPCPVRGAGRPVSPGPGGPSSTTSMISSSPCRSSAPGPSPGSMPTHSTAAAAAASAARPAPVNPLPPQPTTARARARIPPFPPEKRAGPPRAVRSGRCSFLRTNRAAPPTASPRVARLQLPACSGAAAHRHHGGGARRIAG